MGLPSFGWASLPGCFFRFRRLWLESGLLRFQGFPICGYLSVSHAHVHILEPTGSPKFLTFLSRHATLFVDPDRPSESSPKRSLCVGFWSRYTIAICIILINGAVTSLGDCGLPCGLHGSLCTLQGCRSAVASPPFSLLHRCNTRSGWVVSPYPARNFTLPESAKLSLARNGFELRLI
jgi:hypothetical protein